MGTRTPGRGARDGVIEICSLFSLKQRQLGGGEGAQHTVTILRQACSVSPERLAWDPGSRFQRGHSIVTIPSQEESEQKQAGILGGAGQTPVEGSVL